MQLYENLHYKEHHMLSRRTRLKKRYAAINHAIRDSKLEPRFALEAMQVFIRDNKKELTKYTDIAEVADEKCKKLVKKIKKNFKAVCETIDDNDDYPWESLEQIEKFIIKHRKILVNQPRLLQEVENKYHDILHSFSANLEDVSRQLFLNVSDIVNIKLDNRTPRSHQDCINACDNISIKIITDILSKKDITHRTLVLSRYIMLAKMALDKGDYQATKFIISALGNSAVNENRLKATYAGLTPQMRKILAQIEEISMRPDPQIILHRTQAIIPSLERIKAMMTSTHSVGDLIEGDEEQEQEVLPDLLVTAEIHFGMAKSAGKDSHLNDEIDNIKLKLANFKQANSMYELAKSQNIKTDYCMKRLSEIYKRISGLEKLEALEEFITKLQDEVARQAVVDDEKQLIFFDYEEVKQQPPEETFAFSDRMHAVSVLEIEKRNNTSPPSPLFAGGFRLLDDVMDKFYLHEVKAYFVKKELRGKLNVLYQEITEVLNSLMNLSESQPDTRLGLSRKDVIDKIINKLQPLADQVRSNKTIADIDSTIDYLSKKTESQAVNSVYLYNRFKRLRDASTLADKLDQLISLLVQVNKLEKNKTKIEKEDGKVERNYAKSVSEVAASDSDIVESVSDLSLVRRELQAQSNSEEPVFVEPKTDVIASILDTVCHTAVSTMSILEALGRVKSTEIKAVIQDNDSQAREHVDDDLTVVIESKQQDKLVDGACFTWPCDENDQDSKGEINLFPRDVRGEHLRPLIDLFERSAKLNVSDSIPKIQCGKLKDVKSLVKLFDSYMQVDIATEEVARDFRIK